ncbi:MAG: hypothetical protein R5N60_08195 [Cutibacterium granulosum]|nr:hypothetical protein [Cutibacterium granulosum]
MTIHDSSLLARESGMELRQPPSWLPSGDAPTTSHPVDLATHPMLPDMTDGVDDLVANESRDTRTGDDGRGPASNVVALHSVRRPSTSAPVAARLVLTATRVIVECVSGRRPMSHLRRIATVQAVEDIRQWPRGAGWNTVVQIGRPLIQRRDETINAVVMLEIQQHRIALALTLRGSRTWRVTWTELLRNRGVEQLISAQSR